MGVNLCQLYIRQMTDIQIYKAESRKQMTPLKMGYGSKQSILSRRYKNGQEIPQKCSTFLAIKGMQIKTIK